MSIIEVFILALVEGLTEFIPVSSTGHLIITQALMGHSSTDYSKAFNVIIQFGAILAVIYLYRQKLTWNLNFYKKILIAFIPTAIIGFIFKNKVDQLMDSSMVVAISLIIGGFVLIFMDQIFKNQQNSELNNRSALYIGFFQSIAMIPGVSRSAATILAGQIFGLSRSQAAEFSFILAIPTLGAATLYKLLKIKDYIDSSQMTNLALGIFLSFVFAVLAIKFFISILNKYGFKYFGYYRILIGLIVLVLIHKGLINE